MKGNILAIDVGTTNLKMGVFNSELKEIKFFEKKYGAQIFDGQKAEIDPEIWWQLIREGCRFLGNYLLPEAIISLSVTTPGLVAMDKHGAPLTKAILFLDQRSNKQAAFIREIAGEVNLLKNGGNLPVSGGSSLSSILWIKQQQPDIFNRVCKFGHTNTYVVHKFTGNWAIDPSTTSITGMYSTRKNNLSWNCELLNQLQLSVDLLPKLFQSYDNVGNILPEVAADLELPEGCKVLCGGNDAVLSAFSAGLSEPGEILYISGTCDILMVCLGKPRGSSNYNLRTHILPDKWLTLFVLNTGGKSLEWFHSVFCSEMSEQEFYEFYIPSVIENKIDADVPEFEPYLQGSRYSTENLQAAFSGITVNTSRDDFLMALIKGNTRYMASHLEEISSFQKLKKEILLTGGGMRIKYMEQTKRKWLGDFQFKYAEQSSLKGAAKLGKMFLTNLK